jgi:type II secretory ATPase GspE/PulE/Tfp pilus assembly ATPase PilB-like protein/ActR/RegA family two-component response regulator
MTNRVDSLALQKGVAPRNDLEESVALARQKRVSAIDLLVNDKQYSEEALAQGFSEWLKLPRVRIASLTLDPDAAKVIDEKVALKHECLPLKIEGSTIVMAMANPADYDAIQNVQFVSGYTVQPVVATRTEILDGIQEIYGTEDRMQDFLSGVVDNGDFSIVNQDAEKVDLDKTESRSAAELAPVVKMCNLILQEAIRSQASDVHLEPALNCLQVRMRVDGVLREYIDVPKWLHHPLVSRLKILAALDISERRLPQDGRIKVTFQKRSIDLRVSTLPTHFGEKVVMRVLGTTSIPGLEAMGFTEWQFSALTDCLSQPQGMILLSGPTGSGKTTTLYSMISRRRSPEVNIVTVEDPIEYQLPGITQVQVNVKAGLTFAGTLRSILRQDPDVILIGEIRDAETAGIAFQAAITGHLVLSTVHTKSSFAAITRLLELEVDPFLISSSLSLVVAQRLSRRVCTHCKEPYTPSQDLIQKFRLDDPNLVFYRGQGCPECGKTGYSGRMGIYEMLRMTDSIKELVRQKASEGVVRRAAAVMGTRTLLEDGLSKVRQGLTNPEELLRVIEVEVDESLPCPKCGSVIHREFKSCPYCMFTLRNICESCGQDLKPDWKMCPYCTSPVRAQAAPAENSKPSLLTEGTNDSIPLDGEQPGASRQVHALPPVNSGTSREAAALPPVKTPKIVVADDDKGIVKVIEAALEQLPMDVKIFKAGDGVEALSVIESNGADLLILDVMMPRMDGFAVCDHLRKDLRTAFLPILMLTASADQNNRSKGYMVGTDDYMSKPFEVSEFVARVARLLRRTYGL